MTNNRSGRELHGISFSDVTKRYRAVTALDGFSVEIAAGRITAFLGANGSGKTTSMRVLLGLAEPTSGGRAHRRVEVCRTRAPAASGRRRARSGLSGPLLIGLAVGVDTLITVLALASGAPPTLRHPYAADALALYLALDRPTSRSPHDLLDFALLAQTGRLRTRAPWRPAAIGPCRDARVDPVS
jgi:energy-coupling factor transporter ATP-binding protein EcfA2